MKPTLVVLAAGMGSRYGGLKQLDEVGPNGETIMDYSVYDAWKAGFGKVVFVIREHFADDFKNKVTKHFDDKIAVEFVFQEIDTPIEGLEDLPEREKPWGTAHAVLVAEGAVKEPFAVINADDFYGSDGFHKVAQFLTEEAAEERMHWWDTSWPIPCRTTARSTGALPPWTMTTIWWKSTNAPKSVRKTVRLSIRAKTAVRSSWTSTHW